MEKLKEKSPHNSVELHPYLSFFSRHLGKLRDHQAGTSKQYVSVSSFIGGVQWTAQEKDAFFHALSVYSRFRTDLIAVCIGTKNEVEVLEYLALLEEGSRLHGVEIPYRAKLPLAHEVSDSWISWEERGAAELQANEEIWDIQIRTNAEYARRKTPENDSGVVSQTEGTLLSPVDLIKDSQSKQTMVSKETTPSLLIPLPQTMAEVGSPSIPALQQPSASILNASSSYSLDWSTSSQSGSDPNKEDQLTQPQNLSPRSRRRYYKRMHMRQKRASTKGKEVDFTMNKLRPGPKKALRKTMSESHNSTGGSRMESGKTAAPVMSGTSDFLGGVDPLGMGQAPGGELGDSPSSRTTNPRARREDILSGLDPQHPPAGEIITDGPDIFNRTTLARLLLRFISGYDSDLAAKDASIDTETLELLYEILRDFLVQVMSRVIIVEEEHQRFKGATKVWRRRDDETREEEVDGFAIRFALKTMGIVNENPTQYFDDLLGEQRNPVHHPQTGYDDMVRLAQSRNILHQHPLHQDLCLPHYQNASKLHSSQSDEQADEMMDVNTDKLKLAVDLLEEKALDEEDKLDDRRHEIKLWKEVPKLARGGA